MNPQNNVDSQRSMENPGPAATVPSTDPKSPFSANQGSGDQRNIRNTSDDLANSAEREFNSNQNNRDVDQKEAQNYNEKEDERKRYDEADPNWRNPDVEMEQQMQNTVINPELEANIGPQS